MSPGVVGKKTNSRHRDPQLPKAERAWEEEKRELLVKTNPSKHGLWVGEGGTATLMGAVLARRGEVIPRNCYVWCLAFVTEL